MGIGTILISVALIMVVAILIALPLLEKRQPIVQPPSRKESLELEHQRIVRAIRDLDLDYRTHKLTDADYHELRSLQVQQGAEVLRALDELNHSDDVDAEIELAVASLRNEVLKCPRCHNTVRADDQFCPRCGFALHPAQSQGEPKA